MTPFRFKWVDFSQSAVTVVNFVLFSFRTSSIAIWNRRGIGCQRFWIVPKLSWNSDRRWLARRWPKNLRILPFRCFPHRRHRRHRRRSLDRHESTIIKARWIVIHLRSIRATPDALRRRKLSDRVIFTNGDSKNYFFLLIIDFVSLFF